MSQSKPRWMDMAIKLGRPERSASHLLKTLDGRQAGRPSLNRPTPPCGRLERVPAQSALCGRDFSPMICGLLLNVGDLSLRAVDWRSPGCNYVCMFQRSHNVSNGLQVLLCTTAAFASKLTSADLNLLSMPHRSMPND